MNTKYLNRVLHGDCVEWMKKLDKESIDLILTDIPYGEISKRGSERAKYEGQLRKIDKGLADVLTFDISDFLTEVDRICKGTVYIFVGISQISEVFKFFDDNKNYMTRLCVWKKTNPSPMNGQHLWLNGAEFCIFAKKRKQTFNQKCKTSVWDFPVGRSKVHPTEKPLRLFEYLVESSSNEGDVVLDTCLGSGTTAVAAINTGRNWIGIEKEQEYVDVANKRIEEHISKLSINIE